MAQATDIERRWLIVRLWRESEHSDGDVKTDVIAIAHDAIAPVVVGTRLRRAGIESECSIGGIDATCTRGEFWRAMAESYLTEGNG
jgi:hypothetical protein